MVEENEKGGFKQTEVGLIPDDWLLLNLKELSTKLNVGFVGICEPYFTDEATGILLIRTGNLQANKFVIYGSRFVKKDFHNRNKKSQVKAGDLLIARHGSSGNAVMVPNYILEANTLNIVIVRIDSSKVLNQYATYSINSKFVKNQVDNLTAGSTQSVINTKSIEKLLLPLPPTKAEQTAIATVLIDADTLITQLEELIAKKKAIKQGAMQELLKPKKGWEVRTLGDICFPSKSRINPLTSNQNYKCVELEHLSSNSGRLLGYSSSSKLRSQKAIFEKGDVLFGKLRPYLRKFLFAEFDGVCTTEIWVLKSIKGVESKWLYYLVQTDKIIEAANLSTGTKMPRAEWKTVSDTIIHLPLLSEQKRIAKILSDMDAEIDVLETRLEKQKMIKQGMMQVLLTGKIRLI